MKVRFIHFSVLQSFKSSESVIGRKLVTDNPKPESIVKYHKTHQKDTSKRNFDGDVLGYVTPVSIALDDRNFETFQYQPISVSKFSMKVLQSQCKQERNFLVVVVAAITRTMSWVYAFHTNEILLNPDSYPDCL